jgi:hypothetical protein
LPFATISPEAQAKPDLGRIGLPSIANFVFASEINGSDVAIKVAYHIPSSTEKTCRLRFVGTFAVSEERIVSVSD